jgi:hypothetical protein
LIINLLPVVATAPSFCCAEEIFEKESSKQIFTKVQNLCSFNVAMNDKLVIMSAHNLFPNLDSRRNFVSDREVSTIYEFVSKMSLWHYETSWKLVHWQHLKKNIIFLAPLTSSIQSRISEHIPTGIRFQVTRTSLNFLDSNSP